jgi:molybdopterin adenylyltransferase
MPNRAVVLTISDRSAAGTREDRSGPVLIESLAGVDAVLVHRQIVPDEAAAIRDVVRGWLGRCELILTTGGTGIAPRDVTPEAIEPLLEKRLPGMGEVMRLRAFERLPTSILSRSGAGIAGGTLIVYLPGSPKAVRECMEWLSPAIRHACALLAGADHG